MCQEDEDVIESMYQSPEYASHENEHTVHSDSEGEIPAIDVQARIILDNVLLKPGSRILDIGCFDGKLLGTIAQKVKGVRCVGFDVGDRPKFPDKEGCSFVKGSLADLKGDFDLIILSHSIIYIKNLISLFGILRTLLAPNGKVFIHVPDVAVRPVILLLGDQYHYFAGASVAGILSFHGFTADIITGHPFNRDIILLAEKESAQSMESSVNSLFLSELLSWLLRFQSEIKNIPYPEVAILGTTMEASFAYTQISDRVQLFVDENQSKIGKYFHGNPIWHPSMLNAQHRCLIPMGSSAQHIEERLSRIYRGHYFLL